MGFPFAIAAAALATAAAGHPGGLPLQRGVYVQVDRACHDEASSASSWYGGSGYVIQASHSHCVAVHVRRRGHGVFEVRETCRDESMPHSGYRVTETIRVLNPTEYLVHNDFGRFHARRCHE